LSQPLWTFDKIAIASTAQALLQTNQGMIQAVIITDPNGKLIYQKFVDEDFEKLGVKKCSLTRILLSPMAK
jgi:hypothetical protein